MEIVGEPLSHQDLSLLLENDIPTEIQKKKDILTHEGMQYLQ